MRKRRFKNNCRKKFKKRYVVIPSCMLIGLMLSFGYVKHLDSFSVDNLIRKEKDAGSSAKKADPETSVASISEIFYSPYIDTTISPFIEYATVDEAINIAGVDSFAGFNQAGLVESYEAKADKMIQVVYSDGSGNEKYRIRKTISNVAADENYEYCDRSETVTVGNTIAEVRYQNDEIKLIKWDSDSHSYAVVFSDSSNDIISAENVTDYINNIK